MKTVILDVDTADVVMVSALIVDHPIYWMCNETPMGKLINIPTDDPSGTWAWSDMNSSFSYLLEVHSSLENAVAKVLEYNDGSKRNTHRVVQFESNEEFIKYIKNM